MKNILKIILKQLVKLIIWRFEPDVVGITGSVGKTSAKEAIYAVLKNRYRTRKSTGNLNTELGILLTIIGDWREKDLELVTLGGPPGKKIRKAFFWFRTILSGIITFIFYSKSVYPEILILEYGADRPGDIKDLLEIVRPKIAVITSIGDIPAHIEFYENAEAVAKEKARLIEGLFSSNYAVLNADDELIMNMKEKTRSKIMTFGFGGGADIKISSFENRIENNAPFGISFKLEHGGSFVPVVLKEFFGVSHAYAAAIGAAIGLIYGLNLVEAAEDFSNNYKPAKGRMNLILGKKNIYIIDDSYNASPLSMAAALEALRQMNPSHKIMGGMKGLRKIAVLGDMLELGEYAEHSHKKIGKLAGESADVLIAVGANAKIMANEASVAGLDKNNIFSVNTAEEAIDAAENIIKEGDIVLIKASRGIGLDKAVKALIV